jgi:hypothetical protein
MPHSFLAWNNKFKILSVVRETTWVAESSDVVLLLLTTPSLIAQTGYEEKGTKRTPPSQSSSNVSITPDRRGPWLHWTLHCGTAFTGAYVNEEWEASWSLEGGCRADMGIVG